MYLLKIGLNLSDWQNFDTEKKVPYAGDCQLFKRMFHSDDTSYKANTSHRSVTRNLG